jgi:hypothetical protein
VAGRAGRSGVYAAARGLELFGAPAFAGGNGLTVASEAAAPVVTSPLTGAAGSVPFESIPYFAAVGSPLEVVAARAGGALTRLTPGDLAVLTQPNPVAELALAPDAAGSDSAVAVARYRAMPISYHGLGDVDNHPDNPASVTYISRSVELKAPVTPSGKHFVGWFSAPEGGSVVVVLNQGLTAPVDVWARFIPTYTVSYQSPAADQVSDMPSDDGEYYSGNDPSVARLEPWRPGYEFLGWSLTEDGADAPLLAPGARLDQLSADLTLWARWRAIAYTIDYNGPAGDNPPTYTVEDGGVLLADPPVPDGYEFLGWYNRAEGGERIEAIGPGTMGTFSVWPRFAKIPTPPQNDPSPPPSSPPSSPPVTTPPPSSPPPTPPPARPTQTPTPPPPAPPAAPPAPADTPLATTSTPAAPEETPDEVVVSVPPASPTPHSTRSASPKASTPAPPPAQPPVDDAVPFADPVIPPVPPAPVVTPPASPESSSSPPSLPPKETKKPVKPSPLASAPAEDVEAIAPRPVSRISREAVGWTLITTGTVGLLGLGGYWFRRTIRGF